MLFKQQTIEKGYNAALYCRLSKDDGTIEESSSISTQKEMLTQFANSNGYKIHDFYIDDGFSGLNFERPAFKRMIVDIEAGKINMVITKDLSRFARNYIESGVYIEIFFPEKGVRYIAIHDNVDTAQNQTYMDMTVMRNVMNEMYSRDISKKVKTAKKTKLMQGLFTGSSAPYGYIKSETQKGLLVIDERYAPIVRRIFEYAKQGLGIAKIRKIMTTEKIPRPGDCVMDKGGNYERYFEDKDENRYIWSNNSVRGILRNPVYAGHLAGYKRPIPSMKSKKRLSALPEDWLIVRNTHEPIIPSEEWELVQSLITARRKGVMGSSGYVNIFSGIIKCADCGYAMNSNSANRRKRPDIIDCIVYACRSYKTYGRTACTQHAIEARDLHNVVLADIQKHAKLAVKNDTKLLQSIMDKLDIHSKSETKLNEKNIRKYNNRLAELDKLFSQLYEDKVNGNISERNYDSMSKRYEQEQAELEEKLQQAQTNVKSSLAESENAVSFVNQIKEYAEITELSASLIQRLIDKITISEPELINGERIQTVKIYYKFIGNIL